MKRNHDRLHGFLAGILTTILALGLGGAALAASRTIQIEDGIAVTINGARFSPRDVNGNQVPLFAYNGTTYAPVRALCQAAGMTVSYDSATRTAQVTTGDMALAADPAASTYISADRAKEIALQHAGVKAADTVFLLTKLDWEYGQTMYDVEFYCGNTEYDYDIDAVTGKIISYDHDLEYYSLPADSPAGGQADSGDLISEAKAREIAQGKAPAGAQIVKCKLDRDDGLYVYEIELRSGRTEYECDIHAVTGAILKWEVEYD